MSKDIETIESFRFSAERPIHKDDEDLLGHTEVADLLASVIQRAQTPLTVGLYGEWGSGKTGLINLIQLRLRDASIPEVYLDCWKPVATVSAFLTVGCP